MKEILDFKTLDEAVEFWETHDSADYWDDMEEVAFEVDLRRNLLHPKLTVLVKRPKYCPRCQHELEDVLIDYVVSQGGRLVVVADVPALRCKGSGHEFILEETLDKLEKLFSLEKTQKLKPATTLHVPVFTLNMTG